MDAFMFPEKKSPKVEREPKDAETLDIFATVNVPDLRHAAPSVPFGSSEDAADSLSQHKRATCNRSILLTLATLSRDETLSRYEIHERTGIDVEVLCARLKLDLQPDYVECVEKARTSHAKANLRVNGYRLTDAGRKRVAEAA